MALWQIIDTSSNPNGPDPLPDTWDDGLKFFPGEPGFTIDLIVAFAGMGNFNYMGTPNHASIQATEEE